MAYIGLANASGGAVGRFVSRITRGRSTIQARIIEVITQYVLSGTPQVATIQCLKTV